MWTEREMGALCYLQKECIVSFYGAHYVPCWSIREHNVYSRVNCAVCSIRIECIHCVSWKGYIMCCVIILAWVLCVSGRSIGAGHDGCPCEWSCGFCETAAGERSEHAEMADNITTRGTLQYRKWKACFSCSRGM